MKKIAKSLIKFFTFITAFFLVVIVAFKVNVQIEDLEYRQRRHQISDFYNAYSERDYYKMYDMALENDVKGGKSIEGTSDFENFAKAFNELFEYRIDRNNEHLSKYEEYYNAIAWQFLKDDLDELRYKF